MCLALTLLQWPALAQESASIAGTWQRLFAEPGTAGIPPAAMEPPLRAQYAGERNARLAAIRAANERGEPYATAETFCLPTGMPAMMGAVGPFPMEILISDGQVTIIQEAFTQVRRIYLDRPQLTLDDIEPGYYGRSVGHFEGDTLVASTIGVAEHVRYRDVPHSLDMRIDERIHLVAPDTLWVEETVIDPAVLAEPWKFTFAFKRLPDYEMLEYICEDNREYADPGSGATRLRVE